MASSQSDTDYPDDYVNDDVKYLLSWNPKKLRVYVESTRATKIMSTARRPPTSISPTKTTTINTSRVNRSTRPAAFYDKHLAEKLVLKHVILLDTLVVDFAGAVDKAIKNVYQKGIRLPSNPGRLITAVQIEELTTSSSVCLLRELEDGVIEHYKELTAAFCLPIASTLALHPSSPNWTSLIKWTKEVSNAKFAIADCVLKMVPEDIPVWGSVDDDIKPLLEAIPALYPDMAIWEMKSLTVGDEEVMRGVWEMGLNLRTFAWKACKKGYCKHKEADLKRMAGTLVNAPGFDVLSPPWSLPAVDASGAGSLPGSQSRDDIETSEPRKSVYVESSQSSLGGDNPPASVRLGKNKRKAPSHTPWDHGDIVLAPQGDDRIKKKKVVDNSDSSFQGKAGERQEVNAQSFLQQVRMNDQSRMYAHFC